MAPPAPSRNFEQNSPITTVLRQICESYPESSCLRELLQNADDAQASEIEYILDTTAYTEKPLLHGGLEDYHGPALLARNNSVFTDRDFASLASIGDSGKKDDPESTGKYGQGFNSCFHWTDGPWVLSQRWLLFLDPHRDWSRDSGSPGGPTYDFLAHQDSVEMQNHLKTFQLANLDTSQNVEETVIRIPLRTKAQAKSSKIVNRDISIAEITKALRELGQEIREGGTLFLRHVRRVTARVDDTILWQAQVLGVTDDDTKYAILLFSLEILICADESRAMQSIPKAFKEMYASGFEKGQPDEISKAFQVNIDFTEGSSSSVHSFFVQHRMTRSCPKADLDRWGNKRKLFPWVAIAAPLSSQYQTPRGRLFSCLRLPIETNQPVHIHGLFSIVPDRGRLSSSGQTSNDLGAEWNRFMFDECVSVAWTELLVSRSSVAWSKEVFGLWPRIDTLDQRMEWSSLDQTILDRIITQNLPVWNTPTCCVPLQHGLFAPQGNDILLYSHAFGGIHLPLVCLEPSMYGKFLQRTSSLAKTVQLLTPRSVRRFLRENHQDQELHSDCSLLLQYCLRDFIPDASDAKKQALIYDELRDIRLWPTLAKNLVTLKGATMFLPRDLEEMELFKAARPFKTLDLNSLTPQVAALLQVCAEGNASFVRHRALSDLVVDWGWIYSILSPTPEVVVVPRDSKDDPTIRSIWGWICTRCGGESESLLTSTKGLDKLFLIPLTGSRIRRFACSDRTRPTLILQDDDWMHDLLGDEIIKKGSALKFVLDREMLPVKAVKLLRSMASKHPELAFATPDKLESLLTWLAANKDAFDDHSAQGKDLLMEKLRFLTEQNARSLDRAAKTVLKQNIVQLPIFSLVYCEAPYKERVNRKAGIDVSTRPVQIPTSLPPIPTIPGMAFYHPANSHERYIVEFYTLLESMSPDELIFHHLLPFLEGSAHPTMAAVKLNLVNHALNNTWRPSDSWKARFCQMNLIPKAPIPGMVDGVHFRCLAETVDPASSLATIFFEDEDVFPEPGFFERHRGILVECGVVTKMTPQMLLERVQIFSQKETEQVRAKVEHMLCLPSPMAVSDLPRASLAKIRNLKWLPASGSAFDGLRFTAPADCRAADEEKLVDSVLGVFKGNVTHEWKRLFGWDRTIPKEVLTQQLKTALAKGLDHHVDCILTYLGNLDDCSFLKQTPCVLSSRGKHSLPERLFLPRSLLSSYPLAPYLDEVEQSFAKKHMKLLKALDIRREVTYDDLLGVQEKLLANTQSNQLSDEDLNISLALLEVVTVLSTDTADLSAIMIPDTERKLRLRKDIVYGEHKVTGEIASFHFVHPRISPYLVEHFELENSFARATRLGIEFEDEDEDEYTPHEKLTTIISDTLGRYPIESTFSEFLANANDCGATRISWILDECADGTYQSTTLLTEELKDIQGPALFIYNDQVFEEEDFRGFKEIGHGGKIDDTTSTGMFGRGAMTMYHFTDVPMLISKGSFLILDPQQELLPRNKHWKRKAGLRVPLSTARRLFPDQLRPFHGLEGFSLELDYYDGTLFRLPFRVAEHTLLKETSARIDVDQTRLLLEEHFPLAEMSLLFLGNVNKIDFRIRGQAAVCSVQAHRSSVSSMDVFENVDIESLQGSGKSYKSTWRIGRQNIDEAPEGMQKPGRGANKVTECGLAACVNSNGLQNTQQRVFCTLPTPLPSGLPVSVHASFAITGDRKTIPFENFEKETPVKKWNRWLLQECIPNLYIEFLKDLAPRIGKRCFDFWPSATMSGPDQSVEKLVQDAFWALLARSEYGSYQLYPLVDSLQSSERSTPLKTRAGGNARKLIKVASLKSAQFDVLPETVSKKLRPLFSKLCSSLVRPSPDLWRNMSEVKMHHQATTLDAAYLCNLFKDERNCALLDDYLQSFGNNSEWDTAIGMLLGIVIGNTSVGSKHPIDAVNACRIIPMVDQTLGTVRFRSKGTSPFPPDDLMFLPTEIEAELFRDRASSLIKPTLFRQPATKTLALNESVAALAAKIEAPRNPILDLMTEFSNVRDIGVQDIHHFLAHVDSSSAPAGTVDARWIVQFWSYLDQRIPVFLSEEGSELKSASVQSLLQHLKLLDTRVYRYHDEGSWSYITPEQFELGPYVLNPWGEKKEIELCRSLLGLRLVDPGCVPSQLRRNEPRLKTPHAFSRLLRALARISTRPDGSKGDVKFKMNVKEGSYSLLRDLVAAFVKTDEAPGYKDTLRCLKIWPRYRPALSSEGPSYIAAIDALLCADGAMFVPWIANANRFIDPVSVSAYANTLGMLGCTVMPVGSIWAYVKEGLPRELTSNQLQAYLKCIECLAAHDCKPTSIQAPNGFGVMCDPSALFDHKDDTFRGVFRKSEEVHFLHPLFRSQRTYWLNLGLRTKSNVGEMRWKDFLECLTTMVQRLRLQSNNSLEDVQDAEKVTAYLRYPHPDSQYWPNNAWNTITQAKIYRAQNNLSSEPTYRQAQMLQIANKPGPYSIDYAAPRNQMRILWSQRPLLSDPPASAVYEKLPDGGRPEPRLVYQHLQHLISIRNEVNDSELSDYLKDVQATYAYLQERREESASIPAIREARVWLNLPTTDLNSVSSSQLEGALRSAKNLCFNTPLDTHVMERAKNFLIPYESLLRALGCHVMVRPPKQAVAPRSNQHRPIDQILAVIRNMREQGQLSDVTFEAEGVKVPANRNFMAAVSELWRNRFLREWSRGLGAKPNIEVGISMKTSLKTLQYIVDFAYTGVVKWPQLQDVENIKEVADTLDELLDLLQGANSWFMATLHDLTERQLLDMSEVLLRPDNVERIMEEAEIGKAERLVKHCREFIAANKLIVEDCKAMEQDQDGDIFDDIT